MKILNLNMKSLIALLFMIVLMVLTRSHNSFASIHLPDFTIPALFIAGVYFKQWLVPAILITVAVAIDNYAIVEQGVSANCITPAYSLLLVAYAGVYWMSAKFIPTLAIKTRAQFINAIVFIVLITALEWLFSTVSYYAFISKPWSEFPAYVMQWAPMAIKWVLYWMAAIVVLFSLSHHILQLNIYAKSKN